MATTTEPEAAPHLGQDLLATIMADVVSCADNDDDALSALAACACVSRAWHAAAPRAWRTVALRLWPASDIFDADGALSSGDFWRRMVRCRTVAWRAFTRRCDNLDAELSIELRPRLYLDVFDDATGALVASAPLRESIGGFGRLYHKLLSSNADAALAPPADAWPRRVRLRVLALRRDGALGQLLEARATRGEPDADRALLGHWDKTKTGPDGDLAPFATSARFPFEPRRSVIAMPLLVRVRAGGEAVRVRVAYAVDEHTSDEVLDMSNCFGIETAWCNVLQKCVFWVSPAPTVTDSGTYTDTDDTDTDDTDTATEAELASLRDASPALAHDAVEALTTTGVHSPLFASWRGLAAQVAEAQRRAARQLPPGCGSLEQHFTFFVDACLRGKLIYSGALRLAADDDEETVCGAAQSAVPTRAEDMLVHANDNVTQAQVEDILSCEISVALTVVRADGAAVCLRGGARLAPVRARRRGAPSRPGGEQVRVKYDVQQADGCTEVEVTLSGWPQPFGAAGMFKDEEKRLYVQLVMRWPLPQASSSGLSFPSTDGCPSFCMDAELHIGTKAASWGAAYTPDDETEVPGPNDCEQNVLRALAALDWQLPAA